MKRVAEKNRLPARTMSDWIGEKVDRVVGMVSPRAGLGRSRMRMTSRILRGMEPVISGSRARRRKHQSGKKSRNRKYWTASDGSADFDILPDLEETREQCRELVKYNPLAAGIMLTYVSNVVATGIKPQSTLEEEQAVLAETAWKKFVRTSDAGGRLNFYHQQQLIYNSFLENGEVFVLIRRIKSPSRPYNVAVEVIEADRVSTPADKSTAKDVRAGVKIGPNGEPVGYWIRKTHPGDYDYNWRRKSTSDYEYIPAFDEASRPNIIHVYKPTRPGQTRGVPLLAAALDHFKDLGDYLQAELAANLMAACYGIIIKSEDPGTMAAADRVNMGLTDGAGVIDTDDEIEFHPGMVLYEHLDEKIEQFKIDRPGTQFNSYIELEIRIIGASIGFPLEYVLKHFGKTSYSSGRLSALEIRRIFHDQQVWLIEKLCQPIYELVMEETMLAGDLGVSPKEFYADRWKWTGANWVPVGWEWVDPIKEIRAIAESLRIGITSRTVETRKRGLDWDEIIGQLEREAREIRRREKSAGGPIIGGPSEGSEKQEKQEEKEKKEDKNDDDEDE